MRDIYNIDETALYQKMISDVTLATKSQTNSKKEKTQISIIIYYNAEESYKLSLWLIRKTKNLCYFERNKIKIFFLDIIYIVIKF